MPLDVTPDRICGRTIFHDDWWLDIAAQGRLQRVQVNTGQASASLAFVAARYRGFRHLDIPPYTRVLGPAITLPASKPFGRGRNIRHLVRLLVEQLPPYDLYHNIVLDNDVAVAFSWLGFTATQRYTFVLPANASLDRCWSDMNQKTRNTIRSAAKQVEVVASHNLAAFMDLSRKERPARANRNNFPLIEQLFEAAAARGQATVLAAVDTRGHPVAAAILIWGYGTAYFWLSARDRVGAIGGANALVLWRSFELANRMGFTFDLDGYFSVASAEFLAGFGLPPTVRIEISRLSQRYDLVRLSRSVLRTFTPRPAR